MATDDMCDHLAALALPLPTEGQVTPPEAFAEAVDAVLERREAYAEQLRTLYDAADQDPLLTELAVAGRQRAEADRQIRRLIAYGREFTPGPRPYALTALATAAGLGGHSSARVAYGDAEITEVAAITGARPRRRTTDDQTPDQQ
ncbi:hypothetical protein GCM10010174_80700 [Kutzneria viridogrisea]|uniref:DUF222 domain-containing protein n=1 Tax=Kutzneria viridogrisea TaxID=47990 RepID=A0ABR6BZ00_9PSEU|nr:hypothetical protein [Kutzneria viridogrisea]